MLGFRSLAASYEVSYVIEKTKASFNTGETLMKPATLKITEIILGKEAMKKIKQVPLSNDVVTSRIAEISCDIVDQVTTAIKESPVRISLQLDESADISNFVGLVNTIVPDIISVHYVLYRYALASKTQEVFKEVLSTAVKAVIRRSRDVAAAPQTPQLGGAQANFGGPS